MINQNIDCCYHYFYYFMTDMEKLKESGSTEFEEKDMEKFCNEVIKWKTTACKKDEIFKIFQENPYYLFGYFCYIAKKNEEAQKNTSLVLRGLSVISAIIAFTALGATLYQSMDKPSYPYIALLFLIAGGAIAYISVGVQKISNK
jgi:hypothetical protein